MNENSMLNNKALKHLKKRLKNKIKKGKGKRKILFYS